MEDNIMDDNIMVDNIMDEKILSIIYKQDIKINDWSDLFDGFIIKTNKQEIYICIDNYQACCESSTISIDYKTNNYHYDNEIDIHYKNREFHICRLNTELEKIIKDNNFTKKNITRCLFK